jgi:hypothetical protein
MESEDGLQIYIHTLETIASKYGLKISNNATTMAFKGIYPVRSKIAINDNIIEHITLSLKQIALFHTAMKKALLLKSQHFSP